MTDAYQAEGFYTDGTIDYPNAVGKRRNPNEGKYGKPVKPAASGELDENAFNH